MDDVERYSMSTEQKDPKKPAAKPSPNRDLNEMHQPNFSYTSQPANSFSREYLDLLKFDNQRGKSLRAFIRRTLRQQNLGSIDAVEILGEVFLRGHKLTESGEIEIRNPAAWARKTALNYIRELGRKQKQTSPLDQEIPDRTSPSLIDKLILEEDRSFINRALQELDPDQQKLLKLKIVDELSWAEIQRIFASEGEIVSEHALRKRKERALKQLRLVYHVLKSLSELERNSEF